MSGSSQLSSGSNQLSSAHALPCMSTLISQLNKFSLHHYFTVLAELFLYSFSLFSMIHCRLDESVKIVMVC